jgi:two-component system sensor histidine kinase/response regulator
VEIIKTSGDSLLKIINDILDYSKIEAGKIELESIDFNLRTVLEGIADLTAVKAQEKNLEYCNLIHPSVPTFLRGDPGRLRQVLINLIGNAVKFTDEGEVTISVRLESQTDTKAFVRFSVIDTGIGIPEDKSDVLFDSFSQVDATTTRKYGGTGLGLSISKQLVTLMAGTIGVHSKAGKGSEFWFTARFDKQHQPIDSRIVPKQDISGKHILIVDDNRTNRFVLKEDLRLWNCRFDEASGGAEAIQKLTMAKENKDPFEIAIIDMQMPRMDGAQLGEKIKADPKLENTIMIMLTSIGKRGDAKWMRQIGFSAYLKKPIKQDALFECLSTVHAVKPGKETNNDSSLITRHSIAERLDNETRILLVEDNHINKRVALGSLKKIGYKADVAENGLEALQALEKRSYDLVLMDCQMPEMDGYEATRQIRNPDSRVTNHDVPIVAMTANAMPDDQQKCMDAGMNDYLSKPVKIDALSHMLEKWMPA